MESPGRSSSNLPSGRRRPSLTVPGTSGSGPVNTRIGEPPFPPPHHQQPPPSDHYDRYGSPGPSHSGIHGARAPRRGPYPTHTGSPEVVAPPRRASPPPAPPGHLHPSHAPPPRGYPPPSAYYDDPHRASSQLPSRARSDPYAYHDNETRPYGYDPRYDGYPRDLRDVRDPRDVHRSRDPRADPRNDPRANIGGSRDPRESRSIWESQDSRVNRGPRSDEQHGFSPSAHGPPLPHHPHLAPSPMDAALARAPAVPAVTAGSSGGPILGGNLSSGQPHFTTSPTRSPPRPVELRTFFTPAPSLRDLSRWPRDIADAYRRGYDDALRDTAEGSFTIDGTTHQRVPLRRPWRDRAEKPRDDERAFPGYSEPPPPEVYMGRRGSLAKSIPPPPQGVRPTTAPHPHHPEYYSPAAGAHGLPPPYYAQSPPRGQYPHHSHSLPHPHGHALPPEHYGPPGGHPLPMLGRQGTIATPAAPAPQMRHRQMISCHPCRSRKVKCSGGQPCEACIKIKRTSECAYEKTVRRRGKGKKHDDKDDDGNGGDDPDGSGSDDNDKRSASGRPSRQESYNSLSIITRGTSEVAPERARERGTGDKERECDKSHRGEYNPRSDVNSHSEGTSRADKRESPRDDEDSERERKRARSDRTGGGDRDSSGRSSAPDRGRESGRESDRDHEDIRYRRDTGNLPGRSPNSPHQSRRDMEGHYRN